MSLNEKIVYNILFYLDKMNNDDEFKRMCPGITAQEYLCTKVNPSIKPQRLINILNLNVKRIRIDEIDIIAKVLGISTSELVKNI